MIKPVERLALLALLGAGFALLPGLSPLAAASENPFSERVLTPATQVTADRDCDPDTDEDCEDDSDTEDDSQT